ncbi:glutamine--fructose-6-phosphate transaminase (isomerizing) [Patescibacteria group bacterium]|nr:glutamine--fructose-6-phosphate transaminase (isomerizing) [Patescibacteria group bacterium]
MCGVFGYIGNKTNIAPLVLEGLKSLEYRGYDSWGVAVVALNLQPEIKNKIYFKKRIGKIGGANVDSLPAGSLAIGHTRWATHGGVTRENAHPHLDCTESIALIHNGIVENYIDLKKELLAGNHVFKSETDTEVIVHLLEENSRKLSFEEAFLKTFNQLEGLNAIVAIDKKERVILAARKGSPLVIGFGKNEHFIASDPSALLPFTKDVYFLEDDQMAIIKDDSVKIININSAKEVKFLKQMLDWDVSSAEIGEFEHFMIKEIYDQPAVIHDIANNAIVGSDNILSLINEAEDIYLVGCGTASYACLVGKALFSKIAKKQVHAAIGSEFEDQLKFINKKSLIIALSQSGETIDLLEPVRKAQQKGAKILAFVNVLGSSLFRMADEKILIGAGLEKAVASTKAFIGKISHLLLLAYALDKRKSQGQRLLLEAVESIRIILQEKNLKNIKKLAHKISNEKDIFVIGRGLYFPASLEAALKIKEISYIHAEGVAAGELKHGPLALVEKDTPCIVLLPDDETTALTLANAMEMKARGGYIIGISSINHGVFDFYLPIANIGEASVLPMVVVSQLLAYYLTLEKKLDPDKPRNLAKSVTVR